MICPPTATTTPNLTINIYRFDNIISSSQCCNFTTSLRAFVSAGTTVELSNDQMSQASSYRFSLLRNYSAGIAVGTDIGFIDIEFSSVYSFTLSSVFSCYL